MQIDKRVEESRQKAIADYNRYWESIAPADKEAGDTPRIYKCRECSWYFAKPRPVKSPGCPSCHSRKTNGSE